MLLARRIPMTFDVFHTDIDRMFDRVMQGFGLPRGEHPFPALNLWQDGEQLMIEAELPGLKLEDIEIGIEGEELTLKGRREVVSAEGANVLRQERFTGEFVRKLTLPIPVNAEKATATLRDGILTITLPKADHARVRRIPVQTRG